jgi:hypothetical protein
VARRSCGHLWQARFYSCALDQAHVWAALAYVERNPGTGAGGRAQGDSLT